MMSRPRPTPSRRVPRTSALRVVGFRPLVTESAVPRSPAVTSARGMTVGHSACRSSGVVAAVPGETATDAAAAATTRRPTIRLVARRTIIFASFPSDHGPVPSDGAPGRQHALFAGRIQARLAIPSRTARPALSLDAGGEIRTHTPLRAEGFKPPASTVPPPRRLGRRLVPALD